MRQAFHQHPRCAAALVLDLAALGLPWQALGLPWQALGLPWQVPAFLPRQPACLPQQGRACHPQQAWPPLGTSSAPVPSTLLSASHAHFKLCSAPQMLHPRLCSAMKRPLEPADYDTPHADPAQLREKLLRMETDFRQQRGQEPAAVQGAGEGMLCMPGWGSGHEVFGSVDGA